MKEVQMTEFNKPFPELKIKKSKAAAARILLKSLTYSFALFGLLFILLLVVLANMLGSPSVMVHPVPSRAVLTLDLDRPYPESRSDDLLAEFSEEPSLSFYDLIKAVNVAALDNKVQALVADVGNTSLGLAQIQDLREAVKAFRSTGKKAYLYSSGMGSFGGGTDDYYLASAFDEIWMQPNTEIGITGLNIEVPFLKGLLDKVGITAEFYARIVADVCADRKLDENIFRRLVNRAPLSADEGLKEGLIDKTAFKPDLLEKVLDETKGEMIDVYDYAYSLEESGKKLPTIAFLVVDGTISGGKSLSNPLQGESIVGSETLIQQLDEIANNKYVKALLLRINSPGGSYTASAEIWNALSRLKEKRKLPIVVSMGDYAASGGYFIALPGDKILAEASTVTGSIGVLGGKMVLAGLWDKLEINWGEVKFGDNAGILSANHKFSEREKEVFNRSLDNVYRDFTAKVAAARNISPEKMDKLARGRVWTGIQAVENGLADEIGGIDRAVAYAKQLGGIPPKSRFGIAYYPKAKTLQEKIAELVGGGPKISVNKVINQMGLDIESVNMLKRLQYETVLPPFKLDL